jgi:hypothetical protein
VDKRGQHHNRPHRVPAAIVAKIEQHIASFPRLASHYSLKTEKKFLDSELTVRKMHLLWIEKYEPDTISEEAAASQKPQVSYDFYLQRFNKFDLAVTLTLACVTASLPR